MEKATVGIIGLGLIGASMAKALGEAGHRILGRDRDEHVMKYAMLTHTVEEMKDGDIAECDFILLATYPGGTAETLEQIAPMIRKDTIVCDMCGV